MEATRRGVRAAQQVGVNILAGLAGREWVRSGVGIETSRLIKKKPNNHHRVDGDAVVISSGRTPVGFMSTTSTPEVHIELLWLVVLSSFIAFMTALQQDSIAV